MMSRWLLDSLDHTASLHRSCGDLSRNAAPNAICEASAPVLMHVGDLSAVGFWTVDESYEFQPTCFAPVEQREQLLQELEHHVDTGTFGWIIGQHRSVIVPSGVIGTRVMLHVLSTRSHVLGMFLGILSDTRAFVPEVSQKLISIVLAQCASLLENATLYASLNDQAKSLESRVEKRTRQLLLANAEVRAALRARSKFLSTMSHEIRTPMNGVLGMAQLLLDTELSPEQRDYAEAIYSSGESLLTIINDILDFSKVEAGKLEIEPIPFDLQVAVAEVADLLAPKAEEKGLELVVRYAADAPRQVVGDPGRIRQIVLNLAGNAIKFIDAGHVLIEVEAFGQSEEDAGVRISVHDTGVGLDDAALAELFQPFTQADASTTRKFGGTGLGLAICKQLVELMGGEIGAQGVPGEGSTFWFTLRLPRVVEAGPAVPAEADLSGVRVLVVDDVAISRRVLREQLTGWGMRPECAASGAEALERLHAGVADDDPFVVAILDYQMPGMDGEAVARAITADATLRGTRPVSLTSYGRRGDGRRAEEAGFAGYLVKPVWPDTLRDVLAAVLAEERAGHGARKLVTRHSVAEARAVAPVPDAWEVEGPRCRILLAEDNIVNQKVAVGMLQKLGCRVDVAANGQEAVDMWAKLPYDVVFMDCQMPELDGYAATGMIREQEGSAGRTPIVAMTANVMEGDKELCLTAGMDDYISKPVSVKALTQALERWVPKKTVVHE